MQTTAFVPAKKGWFWTVLAAGILFVAALCILLHSTLTQVKTLDATQYTITDVASLNMEYTVDGSMADGTLEFTGYDFIQAGRFYDVLNWVTLYDATAQVYYRLPTQMVLRDDATAAGVDGTNYSFGGFLSRTHVNKLPAQYAGFEVCFAFSGDDQGFAYLIHTGKTVGEVCA